MNSIDFEKVKEKLTELARSSILFSVQPDNLEKFVIALTKAPQNTTSEKDILSLIDIFEYEKVLANKIRIYLIDGITDNKEIVDSMTTLMIAAGYIHATE